MLAGFPLLGQRHQLALQAVVFVHAPASFMNGEDPVVELVGGKRVAAGCRIRGSQTILTATPDSRTPVVEVSSSCCSCRRKQTGTKQLTYEPTDELTDRPRWRSASSSKSIRSGVSSETYKGARSWKARENLPRATFSSQRYASTCAAVHVRGFQGWI